jgi:sortase A
MKLKTIVLTTAAVAAFLLGIWFFVSPSLERQSDLNAQEELLDSIMEAMEVQGVSADEVETPLPFYGAEVGFEPIYEPFYTPYIYEPEPTPTPVPLDPSTFPCGIVPLGILTIERIDLSLPIMSGVDEAELRIAPGLIPQTADIGEIGNAVIAGHRNYTYGSMFNRLDEVEYGDIISFRAMNGEEMLFKVFEILVILPENQIAFIQPQNESIITLYTCTPVRVATHRLLIRAAKI